MFMNQFGTNNGAMGMQYTGNMNGQTIQKPRMVNPLTDEERQVLKNNPDDGFNLNIKPEELAKSFCTHKDGDKYAVVINPDKTVTCQICHETFNPDVCTPEYIEETSRRMENILQTLKFLGVDLSADVVRGYFGFIPYVRRVPQLYKLVNNSFGRYNENSMMGGMQPQNTGANMFNMLGQITNPAQPLYQAQYMNQPWQQPYAGQYQSVQPQMGAPMNPFYNNQAMTSQQQAMMQPPVQPQQQPVAPQIPQQQMPVAAQNPDDGKNKTVTNTAKVVL